MSIRITIAQSVPEVINYKDKVDGSPQQLRKQTGYAHVVNEANEPGLYPEKFELLLGKKQEAFPSGDYTLHPSAFYVREGKLSFAVNRLIPVKAKTNA
jgi:hypothetical protein